MNQILNDIKNIGKTAKNVINQHLYGGAHIYGDVIHKPIGVASKSYGFLDALLHKNIGSHIFEFDGTSSIIGMMANPYLYEDNESWFFLDKDKNRYDNYLTYINGIYFHGTMQPLNFNTKIDGIGMDFYNALINENSIVGAMHQYNLDNALGARLLIPNGATNPNGYEDTHLGVINNFYLSSTLYNARDKYSVKSLYAISQDAYQNFGLEGQFGINSGVFSFVEGSPLKNEVLIGDSTAKYSDTQSGLALHNKFHRSFPLFKQSGEVTQEFIRKSLEGIDLLSEKPSSLDVKEDFTYPNDYLNRVSEGVGTTHLINQSDVVRLIFKNVGNDTIDSAKAIYYTYAENNQFKLNGSDRNAASGSINNYQILGETLTKRDDIVKYTNRQFLLGKYDTLIARFATHKGGYNEKDALSSAVSEYGLSHGRNLLRKNPREGMTNGYEDPYCRVWTFHKQYSKYSDAIRPFSNDEKTILTSALKNDLQINREHLHRFSVKNDGGFVRFAPSSKDTIKSCMFSIENLAWRDIINHTSFAIGPNGGRIMWFPPYDLKFSEQISTNWNATQFIGRGEKIYSYIDSERNGTLSFKLLIDHPSLLHKFKGGNESSSKMSSDYTNSVEQRILRFFAGCDIELDGLGKDEKKKIEQQQDEKGVTVVHSPGKNTKTTIGFEVYFPNNYSGVNDAPRDAINYLLSGVGFDYQNEQYYADKNLTQLVGGYEMNSSLGVSCAENWNDESNKKIITNLYDKNGAKISIKSYECKNKKGGYNYWGYRVDNGNKDEVLSSWNYLDTKSTKLNYQPQTSDNTANVSFAEFASAVQCYTLENENVKKIRGLLRVYKVDNIIIKGYSNKQGDVKKNKALAEHRADTISKWITDTIRTKKIPSCQFFDNVEVNMVDINSEDAKKTRKVEVIIELIQEERKEDNVNISQEQIAKENVQLNQMLNQGVVSDKVSQKSQKDEQGSEYDFFQEIDTSIELVRRQIVDKIKYFDPAFHSITPEGFNARLTFLHQCTRQGATYAASEYQNNVRNLAFGTPPICVLRIGDFYNTKIVIKNIDIQYDETTWDLNDEGIGVMPMMADINIGFTFIGGSDLSGPIARLQNAVSFNYYANTSVYEKQSDIKNEEK